MSAPTSATPTRTARPASKIRSSATWQIGGILGVLLLVFFFGWNHHLMHRYQVQKDDMAKRIAALQRQLAASQSSAMQAQFAREEFKEIAADEEEIRELKARLKNVEAQLATCRGGGKKKGGKGGRKAKGRRRLHTGDLRE